MNKFALHILLLTLGMAASGITHAQGSLLKASANTDGEEPATQILSNALTYDDKTKTSLFT